MISWAENTLSVLQASIPPNAQVFFAKHQMPTTAWSAKYSDWMPFLYPLLGQLIGWWYFLLCCYQNVLNGDREHNHWPACNSFWGLESKNSHGIKGLWKMMITEENNDQRPNVVYYFIGLYRPQWIFIHHSWPLKSYSAVCKIACMSGLSHNAREKHSSKIVIMWFYDNVRRVRNMLFWVCSSWIIPFYD